MCKSKTRLVQKSWNKSTRPQNYYSKPKWVQPAGEDLATQSLKRGQLSSDSSVCSYPDDWNIHWCHRTWFAIFSSLDLPLARTPKVLPVEHVLLFGLRYFLVFSPVHTVLPDLVLSNRDKTNSWSSFLVFMPSKIWHVDTKCIIFLA